MHEVESSSRIDHQESKGVGTGDEVMRLVPSGGRDDSGGGTKRMAWTPRTCLVSSKLMVRRKNVTLELSLDHVLSNKTG